MHVNNRRTITSRYNLEHMGRFILIFYVSQLCLTGNKYVKKIGRGKRKSKKKTSTKKEEEIIQKC